MQLIGTFKDRAVNPFTESSKLSLSHASFSKHLKQIDASPFPISQSIFIFRNAACSAKLGLLGPKAPWATLTIRNSINTFNNGMAAKYKCRIVNKASTELRTRGAGLGCWFCYATRSYPSFSICRMIKEDIYHFCEGFRALEMKKIL